MTAFTECQPFSTAFTEHCIDAHIRLCFIVEIAQICYKEGYYELTDLKINYKTIKKSRAITGIEFEIKDKQIQDYSESIKQTHDLILHNQILFKTEQDKTQIYLEEKKKPFRWFKNTKCDIME